VGPVHGAVAVAVIGAESQIPGRTALLLSVANGGSLSLAPLPAGINPC
jgi:hypothetical protein